MLILEGSDSQFQSLFTLHRVGGSGVVTVHASRVHEPQARLLAEQLTKIVAQVEGRLALEVSAVTQFTCAWINTLLDLAKACTQVGGELLLVGLPRAAKSLFRRAGLLPRFRVSSRLPRELRPSHAQPAAPWRLAAARLLNLPVAAPPPSFHTVAVWPASALSRAA